MPSTPTPTPTPTPTTQALVGLMDGPRGPLLQALEELWFLYLDAWRARGRYPIGYCFLGGTCVVLNGLIDERSTLCLDVCLDQPHPSHDPPPHTLLRNSGGTGRFLKEYEALPEVQTLRTREGRKTRGVPAATAAALARLGVAL